MAFSVDVFPAPFGPIIVTTSPCPDVEVDAAYGFDRAVRHLDVAQLEHDQSSSSTPR